MEQTNLILQKKQAVQDSFRRRVSDKLKSDREMIESNRLERVDANAKQVGLK